MRTNEDDGVEEERASDSDAYGLLDQVTSVSSAPSAFLTVVSNRSTACSPAALSMWTRTPPYALKRLVSYCMLTDTVPWTGFSGSVLYDCIRSCSRSSSKRTSLATSPVGCTPRLSNSWVIGRST